MPVRFVRKSVIAVIADIVRSRSADRKGRSKLQRQFETLVAKINDKYNHILLAKFSIASGDEFEGVLRTAKQIPELIWDIEEMFPASNLRIGFGRGAIFTPIREDPNRMDGPAFHNAREALHLSEKAGRLGGLFHGFGTFDDALNGLTGLLWLHRSRWTSQQRKVVSLLRSGATQSEVADRLQISRQAVSKHAGASGAMLYLDAEKALAHLLGRYVDERSTGT